MKLLEHWVGSHRLQDKVVAELLEDALYEDIYTVSCIHHTRVDIDTFGLPLLRFPSWEPSLCKKWYYSLTLI